MFKFFTKDKYRSLKDAKGAIAAAEKVYSYRKDLIAQADLEKFEELLERAKELIIDKKYDTEDFGELESSLESLMQSYGGNIYPLKTITDYVETIVVAGVLALSVRSFFITPFKIPTNSMYPSFFGMTSRVYGRSEAEPNMAKKAANWIVESATNYALKAPASGDLLIEINEANRYGNVGLFVNNHISSSILGVWPSYKKVYTFYVDGTPANIEVPADFSFDDLMVEAYPLGAASTSLKDYLGVIKNRKNIVTIDDKLYLNLGKIEQGQNILNFDIIGGDMLFVDKFSYNFKKPQVGDPIVFLTKYCDGMTAMNGGVPDDKYYIKRLVGREGDLLEIKDYTLYSNGEPISGDASFDKNAQRQGKYCGYVNDGYLSVDKEVYVPENMFFALGDNSANSLDSRYWGFIPEKAVVGKSLLVFYPFR